jgi:uncharacterized protein
MKLSQFTVIVHHYPTKDHHLLYHTLSQAMIEVDKAGWRVLQHLPKGLPTDTPSLRYALGQVLVFFKTLQAQGFLVDPSIPEGERYLSTLRHRANRPGGEMNVTLLTNLQRCPLACGYCYQKGTHTGGRLEGDVLEECLGFIKRQCLTLQVERLFITYYGSEPLSNKKAIVETATELKPFCQEKGIRFQFGMVTSGVLLTRQVVETLLPLGFIGAQITLDGNQKTHDASRPFQNGKGTYHLIMNHLEDYAGLIQTDVLCVLDERRIAAAYELIDTLAEKGLAERRVRVKFSPVMTPNANASIEAAPLSLDDAFIGMAERTLTLEIAKLTIYAAEKGLVDDLRPKLVWCAMQHHDGRHLVVTPEGKLYTCPTFIGRDSTYEAGHIHTGMGGIDTVLKEQYTRSAQCLSCRYLPICADCRADALHRTGEIMAANPKEKIYDLLVPELLKAHYQLTQRRLKERRE